MAITKNIDIAVEKSQFAAFYTQVARSAQVAQSKFAAVSDAAASHAETLDHIVDKTTTLRRVTGATSPVWKHLARDTATAAYNISNATTSLLKWAGVTSIVSGVLGLGGLTAFGVGIDLLGASVSAQRATSMGLGTSIGGLQSARTNFGRFGNVEGMLGRMQEAKTDVNKRIGLRNLGFTDKEIDENSSDELLAKALPRLRTFAKEHQHGGMLANWLQSKAIPFDAQEAQTLAGAEPGEVEGLSQFFKNKKDFEPSGGVARKWQDFTTQMEKAGGEIQRVFADNLINIEPGLNKLSQSLVDITKQLLEKDGPVAHWLEDLGHGIEWLAKKMEEPAFVAGVEDLVKSIGKLATKAGELAEGIISWAKWLGLLPEDENPSL